MQNIQHTKNGDNEILLSKEFTLYPKSKLALVQLTNHSIFINNNSSRVEQIQLDDVIGCHILEGNKTTSSKLFICIFYYPMQKRLFQGTSRYRYTRSLGIEESFQSKDGRTTAEIWKKVIKLIISGRKMTKADIANLDELETPTRNYLVYVNPFSGSGKAIRMYKSYLRKVLAEAEITHKCIQTEHAGHARDDVKRIALHNYDGIVIVSGDGLVHEVINGLMDRQDRDEAIKMPIGIVPGGSGNALAAAIIYASFRKHPIPIMSPYLSIFEVIRGRAVGLDLMKVEVASDGPNVITKYGILGLVHGIISDVDIEGENLRFLGGPVRNTIFGLLRTLLLRRYQVQISYLPTSDDVIIPSLNEPITNAWRTVTDDSFISISALLLSHVGQKEMMHANEQLSTGSIKLTLLNSNLSASQMLNVWNQIGTETGIVDESFNSVSIINCSAVRISPITHYSKILTLDGERLPYQPVQCSILPSAARVLATA